MCYAATMTRSPYAAVLAFVASGCVEIAHAQSQPARSDASEASIVSPFGGSNGTEDFSATSDTMRRQAARAFGPIGLGGRFDASVEASPSLGGFSRVARPGTGTAQGYGPNGSAGRPSPPPQRTLQSVTQVSSGTVPVEVARRALRRLHSDFTQCFVRASIAPTSPAVHVLLQLEWAPNATSPRVLRAQSEHAAVSACVQGLASSVRIVPGPVRTRTVVTHALEWAAR